VNPIKSAFEEMDTQLRGGHEFARICSGALAFMHAW
jgi:hypothetical protein